MDSLLEDDIKNSIYNSIETDGTIPTAISGLNTTLTGIKDTVSQILEAYKTNPTSNSNSSNQNSNDAAKNKVQEAISKQKAKEAAEKERNSMLNSAIKFINKNATKVLGKKSDYSYLNQKIWDMTNGGVLFSDKIQKLADILGVTYNGDDKTGNVYKKLKSLGLPGFSKGGVISIGDIEKQLKENGDTTLVSGKQGERILTQAQNDLFERFVGSLPELNQIINTAKPLIDMPKIPDMQPVSRNMNNIVSIDNITLPNVKNYDEFKTQMFRDMQTDRKFENMIENMSIDKLDKNYNSLKKLKHRF